MPGQGGEACQRESSLTEEATGDAEADTGKERANGTGDAGAAEAEEAAAVEVGSLDGPANRPANVAEGVDGQAGAGGGGKGRARRTVAREVFRPGSVMLSPCALDSLTLFAAEGQERGFVLSRERSMTE